MTATVEGASDRATALLEAAGDVHIEARGIPGSDAHPFAAAAEAAGLSSAVGTIAFAGQYASGSYAVQFNRDDGHGFSSTWPQWAYEIAKDSLAADKRVWVGSDGDPFGSNLVFVLMYAN